MPQASERSLVTPMTSPRLPCITVPLLGALSGMGNPLRWVAGRGDTPERSGARPTTWRAARALSECISIAKHQVAHDARHRTATRRPIRHVRGLAGRGLEVRAR